MSPQNKKVEHKAQVILKRTLLAMAAAIVLSLISASAHIANDWQKDGTLFWTWVGIHWLVNAIIFWMIGSGFTRRFKDQSLTLPLNYWAIFSIFVFSLLVPQTLLLLYAMSFGTLIFAAFKLTHRHITWMSLSISGSLLLSLYVNAVVNTHLQYAGLPWWQMWLFFSIVLFSFAMASQDVANLRRRLRKRVADLERANRIIERLATTDALTGVYNRHHINNILLQQLELLSRYGCPLSIAILDLDHFKAINDQFGHNVGDEVLKTFCKIARESLRKSDWFGRWGGEEFICIMPHTTVENAHIPMNRIRQAFKSAQIASLPPGYQHTVSIGIAEAKLSDTVDSVIARADERLYQAKRNGRDTIVVSKPSQQPEA